MAVLIRTCKLLPAVILFVLLTYMILPTNRVVIQTESQISDEKGDDYDVRRFKLIQEKRHEILNKFCKEYNLNGPVDDILETVYTKIHNKSTAWSPSLIYQDAYHVLNCNIPKVASTTIKVMMANVTGKITAEVPGEDFLFHQWKYLAESIQAMYNLSRDEIRTRLTEYKHFLFVRHPVDRLVSTYRGKIATTGVQRIKEMVDWIYRFKHGNVEFDVNTVHISFPEFIDWLLHYKSEHDTHLQSYINTCFPCNINYTYIGHVETLKMDTYHILREIYGESYARKVTDKMPHLNSNRQEQGVTIKYLRQLSPQQLLKLQDYVQKDLMLFGYSKYAFLITSRF